MILCRKYRTVSKMPPTANAAALAAAGVQLCMLYPMDVELEDLFMKLMQEEVAPC